VPRRTANNQATCYWPPPTDKRRTQASRSGSLGRTHTSAPSNIAHLRTPPPISRGFTALVPSARLQQLCVRWQHNEGSSLHRSPQTHACTSPSPPISLVTAPLTCNLTEQCLGIHTRGRRNQFRRLAPLEKGHSQSQRAKVHERC
jgi:hypothetical protein